MFLRPICTMSKAMQEAPARIARLHRKFLEGRRPYVCPSCGAADFYPRLCLKCRANYILSTPDLYGQGEEFEQPSP